MIETTDWLTRGIPKEQLEIEKREALMSADLQECIDYDEWSAREYGNTVVDFDSTASKLIDKGYHKQSEVLKEFVEKLHTELRMYGQDDKFNKAKFLTLVESIVKEMSTNEINRNS